MNTVRIPEILLPVDGTDMYRWAVNACDQYTSDAEYWRGVERITAGCPSTYNLIFPEIYLNDYPEKRISAINACMHDYLTEELFKTVSGGFILTERTTASGTRTGIVLAVDLEDYSFYPADKAIIRSTEATILERIPPRVQIRTNAPLELPHIMLLYDDKENSVLGAVKRGKVLYDFDLMCGGGHLKGTFIENSESVVSKFYALCDRDRLLTDYGKEEKMLFAVGDGNHSLAAAKTCWDNLKTTLTEAEKSVHPARFALAEAVNIYDSALKFEPIHRYVCTADKELFLNGLKLSGGEKAYIVTEGKTVLSKFPSSIPKGITDLDNYISEFIKKFGGSVDYIHGEDNLIALTERGGVGIMLPCIRKNDFFRLIISGGNLPKKTFSMGEGYEKRYYVEAKAIR